MRYADWQYSNGNLSGNGGNDLLIAGSGNKNFAGALATIPLSSRMDSGMM